MHGDWKTIEEWCSHFHKTTGVATQEQRDFIEENYVQLCRAIFIISSKKVFFEAQKESIFNFVLESLIHIDQKKAPRSTINIAQKAVYLYLDEERKRNKGMRSGRYKLDKKIKIKKETLIKQHGFAAEDTLEQEISEKDMKYYTNMSPKIWETIETDNDEHKNMINLVEKEDRSRDIDTKDSIKQMLRQARIMFDRPTRANAIRMSIITRHLVPLMRGKDPVILRNIGKKYGVTESRVSQLLKDKHIKKLVTDTVLCNHPMF